MNRQHFQKRTFQPRCQHLEGRRLLAGDIGIATVEPAGVAAPSVFIEGNAASDLVARGPFDVDDFRSAIKNGVAGNQISLMLHGAVIVHHASTVESFTPGSDPSQAWENRSTLDFDVTDVSLQVVGNKLLVSGGDYDGFGNWSNQFKSLYAVTDSGSLELVDTFPAEGIVRVNGPSIGILDRQAPTRTDAELLDDGFQGVLITDRFDVAYDGVFDSQVLFEDANGFGDRINVRAGARLVGPVNSHGFAFLSADFDSKSKYYLIKANATGGELLATFDAPDGLSSPRQLSLRPDGSLEVTASFYFGSNLSKQFGTLTI